MADITNRAAGPRIVYIAGPGGGAPRILQRGETVSGVELVNREDPVLKAWIEAGEIVIGETVIGETKPAAADEGAPAQPSQEELIAAWHELQARKAADAKAEAESQGQQIHDTIAGGQSDGPGGDRQAEGTGQDQDTETAGDEGTSGETGRADADLDALSEDELRAYLTDRGVTPDGRWKRARLITEAEKVKGA